MSTRPRVLFIDAFDSFSNNVVALLETECHVSVIKVPITEEVAQLHRLLLNVFAVVIGPGPGSATIAEDIGNVDHIWEFCERLGLPVFGICLGFQILAIRYGGVSSILPLPRHGISTWVTVPTPFLKEGLKQFSAVQYHSSRVTIGHEAESTLCRRTELDYAGLWQPTSQCPDLIPDAWDFDRDAEDRALESVLQHKAKSPNPDGILMAVMHRTLPFWGIQFHPDSLCSSAASRRYVAAWWNCIRPRSPQMNEMCTSLRGATFRALIGGYSGGLDRPLSIPHNANTTRQYFPRATLDIGSLKVYDLVTCLRRSGLIGHDFILLDSEKGQSPKTGVHSIIGLPQPGAVRIQYRIGSDHVELTSGPSTINGYFTPNCPGLFPYLKVWLANMSPVPDLPTAGTPFWGGLMGYIDHEAGLETIGIVADDVCSASESTGNNPMPSDFLPNACFVEVKRSIVFNHETGKLHVQSLMPTDFLWVHDLTTRIQQLSQTTTGDGAAMPGPMTNGVVHRACIQRPEQTSYHVDVERCRQNILHGDSYRLYYTDQTSITVKKGDRLPTWERYARLRLTNPAPFGAYAHLGDLTLLSFSCERFMNWSRPRRSHESDRTQSTGESDSICQFRPVRGTISKSHTFADGSLDRIGRQTATQMLRSPKELAENVMMADLIWHDLVGVIGSENVSVVDLWKVEECATAYQLVTIIEGRIPTGVAHLKSDVRAPPYRKPFLHDIRYDLMGIDVLATSLPPGSMTGVPKKRSCELLQSIEDDRRRCVYSGVFGYLDVGGGGDFSVVTQSAFRLRDRDVDADPEEGKDDDVWYVGTGSVVTAMSNPQSEWDEMNARLELLLSIFK